MRHHVGDVVCLRNRDHVQATTVFVVKKIEHELTARWAPNGPKSVEKCICTPLLQLQRQEGTHDWMEVSRVHSELEPVDLTALGALYVKLGNVMIDMAKRRSATSAQDVVRSDDGSTTGDVQWDV